MGRVRVVLAVLVVLGGVGAGVADAVPEGGRPLYVTNSGRDFDGNTGAHPVAAYVPGRDGVPVPLGEPVPTGAGARGIVMSADGRFAYVVALEENAVYAYVVGGHGELVALGAPVDVGGVSPFGIAISPDGRALYTANQGSGTVSVFSIGADGRPVLRGAPVSTGVANPRNVAVSPDGRYVFVSHGIPTDEVPDDLVTFPVRPDGTLGPARMTPSGATGTGIAITPDGRFLYVACSTSDAVYAYRIGAGGTLTPVPGSPFPAPKTPEGVALTPDARHLYVTSVATRPVLSPADQGLWTFTVGGDGSLGVGSRLAGIAGPGMVSTPDGRRLYVSDFFRDTVSAFDITSGLPRELAGSPIPAAGTGPAFDAVGVLPDQGPLASFTARAGAAGRATSFDATASADRDGRIARYDWDFGDGTRLLDGGPRPAHTYRHPGVYRITLTVTDDEGCSTALVFTGRSALCDGSPAARAVRPLTVDA